jgi:hypothetical protein
MGVPNSNYLNGGTPFHEEEIPELLPVAQMGPHQIRVPWSVKKNQEPHVCWRAELGRFKIGQGPTSQVVVNDASVTNNWAQQNIFESDVITASPPQPLESRFSVTNNGPFTESAHLVPMGLPRGARLRVRPRELSVPPYSTRTFALRFEFDEEMIDDPCRRDMEILLRCLRDEDHYEELWGASLFRLHLRRKTVLRLDGTWFGPEIALSGNIEPAIGVGRVAIRLDFQTGAPAKWISAQLTPGGTFDASFDASDVTESSQALATAHYEGTSIFAAAASPPTEIDRIVPAG